MTRLTRDIEQIPPEHLNELGLSTSGKDIGDMKKNMMAIDIGGVRMQ